MAAAAEAARSLPFPFALVAEPFRTAGLVYQLGGLLALWPGLFGKSSPLIVFAVATALGNLWIGIGVGRQRRSV